MSGGSVGRVPEEDYDVSVGAVPDDRRCLWSLDAPGLWGLFAREQAEEGKKEVVSLADPRGPLFRCILKW